MTITFVSSSNDGNGNLPNNVTKPAGLSDNDIVCIPVVMDTESAAPASVGFTLLYDVSYSGGDTIRQGYLVKVVVTASSEPASYEVTGGAVSSKCNADAFHSDVAGTWTFGTPVTGQAANGVANSVGPVTSTAGSLVLAQYGCDSESSISSPPAGMTLASSSESGGASVAINSYYEIISTGGSETRSATYSSDASLGGILVATFTPSASGDTFTVTESEVTDAGTISGTYTKTDQWTSSDPTEGTFDGLPLTGFSASAGNWSATAPSVMGIAAGLTYPTTAKVPSFGAGDVVIGDGSFDAAAVSRDFVVKSGFARVVLVTVDESTADGLFLRIDATVDPDRDISTNEAIYYDTVAGTVTVFDTGLYSMSGATDDFAFAVISATDDVDEDYEFNNLVDYDNPVMPADATPNRQQAQTNMGIYAITEGTAPITYSHSGTDAADFTYNSSTGLLTFIGNVADAISTTYDITLTATNAGGSDSQDLTITVVADSTLNGNSNLLLGLGLRL